MRTGKFAIRLRKTFAIYLRRSWVTMQTVTQSHQTNGISIAADGTRARSFGNDGTALASFVYSRQANVFLLGYVG